MALMYRQAYLCFRGPVAALSQSSSVDELHWLDVPELVQYKLCATVCRCLQHKAPQYMIDCCVYTSDIAHQQHLRSAGCHQLLVPRHRRSMFGHWAFTVAGLAAWTPSGLELVTRLPSRSDTFYWQFSSWPENSSFLVLLAYTAY